MINPDAGFAKRRPFRRSVETRFARAAGAAKAEKIGRAGGL
jgi:hypothetical protein